MSDKKEEALIKWIGHQDVSAIINLVIVGVIAYMTVVWLPQLVNAVVVSSHHLEKINISLKEQNTSFLAIRNQLDMIETKVGGTYIECKNISEMVKKKLSDN